MHNVHTHFLQATWHLSSAEALLSHSLPKRAVAAPPVPSNNGQHCPNVQSPWAAQTTSPRGATQSWARTGKRSVCAVAGGSIFPCLVLPLVALLGLGLGFLARACWSTVAGACVCLFRKDLAKNTISIQQRCGNQWNILKHSKPRLGVIQHS